MATDAIAEGRVVETRIPARLDRLPWSRWHWMVLVGLGTVGFGILLVRRNVPESPRWMFIHGRADDAEGLVDDIERQVKESTGETRRREPRMLGRARQLPPVGPGPLPPRARRRSGPRRAPPDRGSGTAVAEPAGAERSG